MIHSFCLHCLFENCLTGNGEKVLFVCLFLLILPWTWAPFTKLFLPFSQLLLSLFFFFWQNPFVVSIAALLFLHIYTRWVKERERERGRQTNKLSTFGASLLQVNITKNTITQSSLLVFLYIWRLAVKVNLVVKLVRFIEKKNFVSIAK